MLELINIDADVVRQVRLVNATTSLVIMDHAYMTRLWKDLIASTCTFLNDYSVLNAGKVDEKVLLGSEKQEYFKKQYSQWLHIKNLGLGAGQWSPCEYFDQLSKAMVASHSIFNYSIFLYLLPNRNFCQPDIS